MKLTPALKSWLVANVDADESFDNGDFRQCAADALTSGDLTVEKYTELSTTAQDAEASEFNSMMKGIGQSLVDLKTLISDQTDSKAHDGKEDEEYAEGDGKKPMKKKPPKKKPPGDDEEEEEEESKASSVPAKKSVQHKPSSLERMVTSHGGQGGYEEEEKSFSIRVKEAADQYDTTKSAKIYPTHTKSGRSHPNAGTPVRDFDESGRIIDDLSQRDKAVVGAFSKFMVAQATRKSRTLAFQALPGHDKELLCYAMENMEWGGSTTGEDYADIKSRKLTPHEQKALIDDSTSGGLEAAPIVFDDDVIQTPLLHGELFPLVKVVPLDRGRRIEGVATGTVTGGWGGVDDTAISLFNTASYVTAFDTTIFRWEGAVRVGLDFLSDTPIDFGQHLTSQYGERLLEDLDDVIASGNGTTQPEGVINKTGTTSISFGGATTIGSYESLRFGVAKPEHRANLAASAVFCGTETSYQRARALPVGASDARRLGGSNAVVGGVSDYGNYNWMGLPYKINESLTNAQLFYAILGRYRMYRRRGLTMRTSTEGDTLIRRNEMLLVAMARYGGQLERGAVAAITTTAPV